MKTKSNAKGIEALAANDIPAVAVEASRPGHSSQYKTEVLFDAGIWQLKAYPYKDNWNSLILHFCHDNRGEALEMIPMWRLPAGLIRGYTDCPRCGEEMPDKIITLWRLHNMDQIQRYHAEFGGALTEIHPA